MILGTEKNDFGVGEKNHLSKINLKEKMIFFSDPKIIPSPFRYLK